MPMPEPKYLHVEEEIAEEQAEDDEHSRDNQSGLSNTLAAWLARFCETAAGDIVRSAVTTVTRKRCSSR